jgi:ribosomal protein S18 acetylase RimI-like enzyme
MVPFSEVRTETHGLMIRPLKPADRPQIRRVVVSSGRFTGEEIATAMELVDKALKEGEEASGYLFAVMEERGKYPSVQGYACYGPTPLTQGVYDLYWIVVDPAAQGKGRGRRLIDYVERDVLRRRGRMIVIETSSHETYSNTTRFYRRAGYNLVARIRDFYRIGDDKLTFSKNLRSYSKS